MKISTKQLFYLSFFLCSDKALKASANVTAASNLSGGKSRNKTKRASIVASTAQLKGDANKGLKRQAQKNAWKKKSKKKKKSAGVL